ncbi:P-loop containing nucleoside triphosphate hydrolase protein [Mycena capillaripes]|nr:P-loop containing nucleoside triphosphate hydrolase protein [Mycena capillaripes]
MRPKTKAEGAATIGLPILEGKISFQPATQYGQNAVKDGAPKVSDIIGFVGQNDYLLPHLTVRETLTFSAALRLPKAVDNNTVRHVVNQTIEELGLKECADIVVGGIFRKGISGGERRRLSIGCVLVTMPSVLILDEATTGLDATSTFLLLQTLSDLAKRHSRTIILSLHAPRSDAFVLFDRLIVLSKGDVMYSGIASESLGWFEEHGCKLKKETNPSDFLVDVTSVDNRSSDREDESRVRFTILVQAWKDREHEKDIPPPLTGHVAHNISRDSQGGDLDEDASNIARPGPIKQTRILLHRSHLNVYRNYEQLAGFLIQSIGIGVFMGLTYFDLQGTPAGAAFQLFPGYFYLTQVGVTGVPLTQCDGDNVLRGLDFFDTPLIVYFAAEIGIIVVLYVLSGLILQFHKPGGVKHTVGGGPESRDKESALTGDMDIARAKIDIEIRNTSFKWVRPGLPLGLRKPDEKKILNEISSFFPAGDVSAILGPSSAGKSTILQLLSHRKLNAGPGAHFEMTSDILFNGLPATEDVRNSVAFVEQEDYYHLSALTVRETRVKICSHSAVAAENEQCVLFEKRKIARAEEVLLMLGLKDCADIYVGGELLKGISGGEKRRLSLAVQMISDPSVLVVDEPTSGLDSFIANNVMECLKQIARSGRTVIVSIHQPRSDIFHSSDNMLILAKGGHAVFSGKREQAVRIMESQGFALPSLWFNPADHLLDLVTVDQRPGKTGESRARVDGLISFWNTHRERVDRVEGRQKSEETALPIVHESRFTPFYIAFPVVWERMFRNLWRQKDAFWGRLIQPPFAGILLLMFYERASPSGGQDRIGVVLQATSAIPFVGLISGIAVFPQDRQLFMHEYHSSAAYSCTALILAYTLMEAPFQLLAGFLYAVFAAQRLIFINECTGLQFRCSADDIAAGICTAQSGEELLQLYSLVDRNTGKLTGIAIATAIAWRILAWAALKARMSRE